MTTFYYTLNDELKPEACSDVVLYHAWKDSLPERSEWYSGKTGLGFIVGLDEVGEDRVSTVFLGIDHGLGFSESGPVLWETMVFPEAEVVERYESHAEALAGHKRAVDVLRAGGRPWAECR